MYNSVDIHVRVDCCLRAAATLGVSQARPEGEVLISTSLGRFVPELKTSDSRILNRLRFHGFGQPFPVSPRGSQN